MANRAKSQGYNKIQDYINDFQSSNTNALEQEAKQYETALDQAKGACSIDEFAYKQDMSQWTPAVSQILRAHSMGMTLDQFNHYMQDTSHGFTGVQVFKPQGASAAVRMDEQEFVRQYRPDYTKYTQQDINAMNSSDFQHLQTDLKAAGMPTDMYRQDFTKNVNINAQ